MNSKTIIHADCRFFLGYIPCRFHKSEGAHCENCSHYDRIEEKILIIKLGAIGDVIRTTPLLEKLKVEHPKAAIWWLTLTPEILPPTVDRKLKFDLANTLYIENVDFDLLINLDKDPEACALAKRITAKTKFGFTLIDGVPSPINSLARQKYVTGLFDDISKANTKSYPEEIFEICGYRFNGEKYQINHDGIEDSWNFPADKKIVGLNTGCGARWKSRLWPEEYWIELAKRLKTAGYEPILLGGPDEDERNKRIQKASGTLYFGHFPLKKFIGLMDRCDLIVTAVSMAMHIAIALDKKLVLFNNIFNKNEFELYGLGKILEPPNCQCYFAAECDHDCMKDLKTNDVYDAVAELLSAPTDSI